MRVNTSYFAKWRSFQKTSRVLAVSRSQPRGYNQADTLPSLFPPYNLLMDFKAKRMTEEEFTEIYKREVLECQDPADLNLQEGDILVCWCGKDSFCHRNLIAEWLRSYDYEVKEIR